MRILYFADIRFPLERANGIQTMETVWHLAERGHHVDLYVRSDNRRPARDPFAFYGLLPTDRLRIVRVRVAGTPLMRRSAYVAAAVGAALRAAHGASVLFTRDLGVAAALLRVPRRFRAPLVYESHAYGPVVAEALPELVTGGAAASPSKLRRLKAREAFVWQHADGYVTTTATLAGDLSEWFGSRRRITVIPNGVLVPKSRTFPPPPERPPVVAYAGHLYPWKGVDVMLRALTRVPEARGLIVGGFAGEADIARLKALATSLGLDGRVSFTGLVPATAVADQLRHASVLVVPTRAVAPARYTCPLKMFEYMTMGRPIVAADLSPVREVLRHGTNALLVPPDQPEAFAEAITELLRKPDEAARVARQAFDDVEEYSWSRRATKLEALFEQVVEMT